MDEREQLAARPFCRIKVRDGVSVARVEPQNVDRNGLGGRHPRFADKANLGHAADLGLDVFVVVKEGFKDHLEQLVRHASAGAAGVV